MQALLKNVTETGAGMGGGLAHFFASSVQSYLSHRQFRGAGGIGLVPFALAPFGILARRRDLFAKGLVLLAALVLLSWF